MKSCPKCQTKLPEEAHFCFNCGSSQTLSPPPVENKLEINWDQALAPQINAAFFPALRHRLKKEYREDQFSDFSERLYESGFRDVVQRRAEQVGEKLQLQLEMDAISRRKAARTIRMLLEELLDFFIIRFCPDFIEYPLPEAILKYQHLSWEEIDLFQMVLDYLDFAHELETVYTDFLIMPVEKLKNAGRSFLFPEKDEKILLICDQSILGSCKEGFALTEKAIYWKAHLQKARQVPYTHLNSLEIEKSWLNINTYFFNATPSLNHKMLKLLSKIKDLQSDT